ncbi:MAG: hypothetical protein D6798_04345 [Deltaproteobacteria bacterium]|nr:MAG: hypothetical protein D6798_04345 [Deltaproteobacteria bacterium]
MNVRRFVFSGLGCLLWTLSSTGCGGSPSASTAEGPAAAPAATLEPAAGTAEEDAKPATPEPAADSVEPAPPAAEDAAAAGPPPEGAEEGEFHEVQPPDDAAEALDLPSFSQLIGDGPTVTITVDVEGASAGELAFQTIDDDGFAHMIHVQRLEGGTATIVAPAEFDEPVYVSLAMPEAEFSPDPHAVGSAAG